jgi:putative colanic acid biosynthesis glycosyltransferase
MNPKITVITISLENYSGLKETVDSLLAQTNFQFEHLIVDGGSKDSTVAFLEQLQVPWNLKWISEKDQGRYEAMNKGVSQSTGEFVWFLNSGDKAADPLVIADFIKAISEYPEVEMFYGKVVFATAYGNIVSGRQVNASDFRHHMPISHPAILFRREQILKNPYRTDFKMISDWILIQEVFNRNAKTFFLDRIFAIFDVHGVSSTQPWKDMLEKLKYQKEISAKLSVLIHCGGKQMILSLLKLTRTYQFYKRWQLKKLPQ